jgi:arsenite/tail-anchored protein-transporting ATPase
MRDAMHALTAAAGDRSFVFVVGKGGVGKTTTAGALALGLADEASRVRLLSTDPAHSIGDLFGTDLRRGVGVAPCSERLVLEAFDAEAAAAAWTAAARPALAEIMEAGTYLDAEDVRGVLDLSLPGIDELMAALRLADLAGGGERIVVDTAPTGHTLRLLDAADAIDGWLEPLRAMAAKAAIVGSQLTGVPLRLSGEALLDELHARARAYRSLLAEAAFLVVERPEPTVRAATDRLIEALRARRLRVAAVVVVGVGRARLDVPCIRLPRSAADGDPCARLRSLAAAGTPGAQVTAVGAPHLEPAGTDVPTAAEATVRRGAAAAARTETRGGGARAFLAALRPRILLFAGKGGVGKTTCAAAAAYGLSAVEPVLLVGTDPAGTLADVLGVPVGGVAVEVAAGLRARQIDAAALLADVQARYRDEIRAVFAGIGLDEAAAVDRAVVESFWNLAPPGADEVMALVELTDAAEEDVTIVVDAAPTGHFLRLLEMPELVGQWTRALLRILARYHGAVRLDGPTERVLAFAKQLRALRARLSDPAETGTIIVTLDEPLVRAETERLRSALDAARTPVVGCVVNRAARTSQGRWRAVAAGAAVFAAPERAAGPVGAAALDAFLDDWERVA